MSPRDGVRLKHMIDAGEDALRFVSGRARADLDRDVMLRFALVHAVQIIGEAASKVSAEGRAELPDVPWPTIIGMRNRLVHAYFDINLDILWSTVQDVVPSLLERLRAIPLDD
jgi:uncharacterized protein with HEPN domain